MKWQIGYSQCDITPESGHALMAGFGKDRVCHGTYAPLRAQALAMRDISGYTSILITADVLGFDRTSIDAMRFAIHHKHGIPPEAIVFCASHTHWGPGINFSISLGCGPVNPWYVSLLEKKLLSLVDEALRSIQNAGIQYGEIDFKIGINRRKPTNKGILFEPYSSGSYDTHTPILKITQTESGNEIILVGHACHPTSSGDIDKWTPDYPGAMRERIEQVRGKGTHAMFVMGCGGDTKVVHRDAATNNYVFASHVDQSKEAGIKLADAVLDYLKNESLPELQSKICCARNTGVLTYGKRLPVAELKKMAITGSLDSFETWWARQLIAHGGNHEDFTYETTVWKLGDLLTIILLEGEVCSPLGPVTRSLSDTPYTMSVAYANVVSAYIPSQDIVKEGGYEGNIFHRAYFLPAPFSQNVEQEFLDIVSQAIKSLN